MASKRTQLESVRNQPRLQRINGMSKECNEKGDDAMRKHPLETAMNKRYRLEPHEIGKAPNEYKEINVYITSVHNTAEMVQYCKIMDLQRCANTCRNCGIIVWKCTVSQNLHNWKIINCSDAMI